MHHNSPFDPYLSRMRNEIETQSLRAQIQLHMTKDSPQFRRTLRFTQLIQYLLADFLPHDRDCRRRIEQHLIEAAFAGNCEIINVPPECDELDKLQLEWRMLDMKAAPILSSPEAAAPVAPCSAKSAWLPMSAAPRDRTAVLLKLKDRIPLEREDLRRWDGLIFVGRNYGSREDWGFAAPVGQGGFPDEWFEGWRHIDAPPQEVAWRADFENAPSEAYEFFLVRPQGNHPGRGGPFHPTTVQRIDGKFYTSDNELDPIYFGQDEPDDSPMKTALEWKPLPADWLTSSPVSRPAPQASREKGYAAARANLQEAWAAMALIRETVETLGPIGAVPAAEHLDGPTFMHEAEAIVNGIQALALSRPESQS